jgi:predicted nucleotidyltransferase component of viral defense system
MADSRIDYKHLYQLQDKVLEIVYSKPSEFYLTGGTCLHRFYFEERYSDDLDFFTDESPTFAFSIRELKSRLSNQFKIQTKVEARDFIRLEVKENKKVLQIDFVNDRVPRFGQLKTVNKFLIDNPLNILSNKLTAVISRDNPKDIFDIWVIYQNQSIQWDNIIKEAKEKAHFQKNELIFRLESFPIALLEQLNTINPIRIKQFKKEFRNIIESIINSDEE